MKFILELKQGHAVHHVVQGLIVVPEDAMTAELYNDILILERTVERLTGLRCHVHQREDTK